MTPDAETALIARAVANCHAEREVTYGYPDPDCPVLGCSLAEGHDGIVHYDPVDGVFWIPAQPGMTRDQAETVARRIREAMAA